MLEVVASTARKSAVSCQTNAVKRLFTSLRVIKKSPKNGELKTVWPRSDVYWRYEYKADSHARRNKKISRTIFVDAHFVTHHFCWTQNLKTRGYIRTWKDKQGHIKATTLHKKEKRKEREREKWQNSCNIYPEKQIDDHLICSVHSFTDVLFFPPKHIKNWASGKQFLTITGSSRGLSK